MPNSKEINDNIFFHFDENGDIIPTSFNPIFQKNDDGSFGMNINGTQDWFFELDGDGDVTPRSLL